MLKGNFLSCKAASSLTSIEGKAFRNDGLGNANSRLCQENRGPKSLPVKCSFAQDKLEFIRVEYFILNM